MGRKDAEQPPIADYRHSGKTRKNIPPAGLAAQGRVRETPKVRYVYDPHRPPALRFDPTGKADALPELLQTAQERPLTPDEAQMLADALRTYEPWLEWSGKREQKACEVDPVALHMHERVSTQAILRVAARQDVTRSLFADPEQDYRDAVQFYEHDVDWANRLILGDSLQVMASLARREDLAGKVQMIYMDPPYGIKYASNFQSEVGRRDVRDRADDLTREPEVVKAYRDTWTLGVHSYLAYLRDRLYAAKELLADTGSIFVQIGDENLHRVRMVMDEVFEAHNRIAIIIFYTTSGQTSARLPSIVDYVLWYSKHSEQAAIRPLYEPRSESNTNERYDMLEHSTGWARRAYPAEMQGDHGPDFRRFRPMRLDSQGAALSNVLTEYVFRGRAFAPLDTRHWTTSVTNFPRLHQAGRLTESGDTLEWRKYFDDFAMVPRTNVWLDTMLGAGKVYAVQTASKVIERCLLMTTEPGDLVLDPTLGSGTTAYVAEQWERRWIGIDCSRVAIAIARQRLLTAKYDYYRLKEPARGVASGLECKKVPHITLKSIAQSDALDPIFATWEPLLAEKLEYLNLALSEVTPELRRTLRFKLAEKEKREGKKAVTDADRRRWVLPPENRAPNAYTTVANDFAGWYEWEVPFDTDPDWPEALQEALTDYRKAWRAKMDEVNTCIQASAGQEELVDQPEVDRKVLRVSGPFSVEGVIPVEESLDPESPIGGEPEALETFDEGQEASGERQEDVENAEAYLDRMVRLMRSDGVRFLGNNPVPFDRLDPVPGDVIHAEGEWTTGGETRRVGVAFGPQYGPITAKMVEDCLRQAHRRGYDDLVFAGFSFDGAAQAAIQDDPNPKVRSHMAHIRPDVQHGQMEGLLKATSSSQLFTVFGLPRVRLNDLGKGEFTVTMEGMDVYNPVDNTLVPTGAAKVAAWFLDADYDGATFCITQAFFPDRKAWDKLAKALKGIVDEERFDALSGTTSLPFRIGEHGRVAVKAIDPRGNEAMKVIRLGEASYA